MSTEGAASRSAIVIRHGASKQNPKPLPSKYAAALAMVEKTVEKNVVHSNLTEELLVSNDSTGAGGSERCVCVFACE